MIDPSPPEPTTTHRYQAVTIQARAEALARGHRHIGPEHLLLAILADTDSVAAAALRAHVDPRRVLTTLNTMMVNSAYQTPTATEPIA